MIVVIVCALSLSADHSYTKARLITIKMKLETSNMSSGGIVICHFKLYL